VKYGRSGGESRKIHHMSSITNAIRYGLLFTSLQVNECVFKSSTKYKC